ncbi:MAG: hypothetical protein GY730_02825 [bacterium]|nr:hypothetical protein [bacterium]
MISILSGGIRSIPSGFGGGSGGGGYSGGQDEGENNKRSKNFVDATEEIEKELFSSERAAAARHGLRMDYAMDKGPNYDEIIVSLHSLNSSAAKNRISFVKAVNDLISFISEEAEVQSVYIRFIFESFIKNLYYFDEKLKSQLINLITDLRLMECEDDEIRSLAEYIIKFYNIDWSENDPVLFKDYAIVTHPCIKQEGDTSEYERIYVVDHSVEDLTAAFHKEFYRLLKAGSKIIYVILPNSKFWSSYFFALKAAKYFKGKVQVIDSGTYGTGLFEMVKEVNELLPRFNNVNHHNMCIKQCSGHIWYWIILNFNDDNLLKRRWVAKMKEKTSVKDEDGKYSVISLWRGGGIIYADLSFTRSFNYIEDTICHMIEDWEEPPYETVIEYFSMEEDVVDFIKQSKLSNNLRQNNLSIKHQDNEFLISQMGSYIGACIVFKPDYSEKNSYV